MGVANFAVIVQYAEGKECSTVSILSPKRKFLLVQGIKPD
jgi:hypothetical protein